MENSAIYAEGGTTYPLTASMHTQNITLETELSRQAMGVIPVQVKLI